MAHETSYPDQPHEVWRDHHFVIMTGGSHSDGYGETSHHLKYHQFRTREEWEAEIDRLEQQRGYSEPYVAMEVFPAKVERKVLVGVTTQK